MSNYENDDLEKKEVRLRNPQRTVADFIYPIEPLVQALAEYDATKPEREAMFEAIGRMSNLDANEQFKAWEKAEKDALEKVQEAFYQLTKDRNCRDNCGLVGIEYIRKLVAKYGS